LNSSNMTRLSLLLAAAVVVEVGGLEESFSTEVRQRSSRSSRGRAAAGGKSADCTIALEISPKQHESEIARFASSFSQLVACLRRSLNNEYRVALVSVEEARRFALSRFEGLLTRICHRPPPEEEVFVLLTGLRPSPVDFQLQGAKHRIDRELFAALADNSRDWRSITAKKHRIALAPEIPLGATTEFGGSWLLQPTSGSTPVSITDAALCWRKQPAGVLDVVMLGWDNRHQVPSFLEIARARPGVFLPRTLDGKFTC